MTQPPPPPKALLRRGWSDTIKGYLQEGRTYAAYLVRPRSRPARKFVLLAGHRSGSTLLVSLLNAHPQITCEGELLYRRKAFPAAYLECRARLSAKPVFGFKLMPSHLYYQGVRNALDFMTRLRTAGYALITLRRRDRLQAALSLLFALQRGVFHTRRGETNPLPRLRLPPAQVETLLVWLQRLEALMEEMVQGYEHLAFVYEDDLFNPQRQQTTVAQIAAYLGCDPFPVSSDLTPIAGGEYAPYIANLDEIRAYLSERGWSL